jgi:Zn-dependent peptidase ImmA (M78 family)
MYFRVEIQCVEQCDPIINAKAYYIPDEHVIVLCCDNIYSTENMIYTLLHELIHAYDVSGKLKRVHLSLYPKFMNDGNRSSY